MALTKYRYVLVLIFWHHRRFRLPGNWTYMRKHATYDLFVPRQSGNLDWFPTICIEHFFGDLWIFHTSIGILSWSVALLLSIHLMVSSNSSHVSSASGSLLSDVRQCFEFGSQHFNLCGWKLFCRKFCQIAASSSGPFILLLALTSLPSSVCLSVLTAILSPLALKFLSIMSFFERSALYVCGHRVRYKDWWYACKINLISTIGVCFIISSFKSTAVIQ